MYWNLSFKGILSTGVLSLFLLITGNRAFSSGNQLGGTTPPQWKTDLSSYMKGCNGTADVNCQYSSPATGLIDGDTRPDIVVATNKGYVVALNHNGSILWATDTAPAFGLPAGAQEIHSSPAIGDIDNDGKNEIVVGVGLRGLACSGPKGGIVVLEHNGSVKFIKLAADENDDGCPDGVFSTPAIANLDADPQLEIVYGGFDKRIMAINHDGTNVSGFPVSSYHRTRFPSWEAFDGTIADTIWSSPAIANLDNSGMPEILIGTDEGMYESVWQGNMGEWSYWDCPYALPSGWSNGYCGGSLYGISANGQLLPNFPRYYYETVFSSPVVADVDFDGDLEIFSGLGYFYEMNSPTHPIGGQRLIGLDHQGNELPGWEGGISVDGATPAAPAIGNIYGDSKPEIIIPTMNSQLYAFQADGSLVPGFPMKPRLENGQNWGIQHANSVVLGDYDGDELMEIFINNGWATTVIDGNGNQLTGDNFPANSLPIYYSFGSLLNSPAVEDIDLDGKIELITFNHAVHVFDLPNASAKADWTLEKGNSARTSSLDSPIFLNVGLDSIVLMDDTSTTADSPSTHVTMKNTSSEQLNWNSSAPAGITISPQSGALNPGQSKDITVSVNSASYGNGFHNLGTVQLAVTLNNGFSPQEPYNLPIQFLKGELTHAFLPAVSH